MPISDEKLREGGGGEADMALRLCFGPPWTSDSASQRMNSASGLGEAPKMELSSGKPARRNVCAIRW